jgi:hypothetical protein
LLTRHSDVEVAENSVDADVTDGWVTLTGDVTYQVQSTSRVREVTGAWRGWRGSPRPHP